MISDPSSHKSVEPAGGCGRSRPGVLTLLSLVLSLSLAATASAQTRKLEVAPKDVRKQTPTGDHESQPVRLDHVKIAVRDLGQAKNRYRHSLGLEVSQPRRVGSLESLAVGFADGTALELAAAVGEEDALASFYRKFLRRGEGPAFVALDAGPVAPLARRLGSHGWHTTLLEGEDLELLTIDSSSLGHLVFVHSTAGSGGVPSVEQHRVQATGIAAVWIDSPDFAQEMRLYSVLGLEPLAMVSVAALGRTAVILPLERGGIYLLDRRDDQVRPIRGLTLEVENLSMTRQFLSLENKSLHWLHDRRGRSMTLRETQTNGLFLEFLDPDPR